MKAWLIGVFFIIFFALRPTEYEPHLYMADTIGYANTYDRIKRGAISLFADFVNKNGEFNYNTEFLFYGIRDIMAGMSFSVHSWFFVVASIFVIPKLIATRILFPHREYLAFLFLITAMGFYSGGINGIRNADGSSMFLIGLVLMCKESPNILLGSICCLSSYFFHHSEIILIASLPLALLVKTTNKAILIWLFSIAGSLIAGNQFATILGPLFEDDRVDAYITLNTSATYARVFRWDFLIYSAAPVLMGWYTTVRKGIKDKTYQIILNTYIISNAVWIVFMYAAYTNRFAALSWSLYPIVLCYPLLKYKIFKANTPLYTAIILCCQLIFITIIL